eukprot:1135307-Prymnesium_polylepis.1
MAVPVGCEEEVHGIAVECVQETLAASNSIVQKDLMQACLQHTAAPPFLELPPLDTALKQLAQRIAKSRRTEPHYFSRKRWCHKGASCNRPALALATRH